MSLKTDFWDGATGLNEQMNDVFDAGVAYVVANSAAISAELITKASSGVRTFTLTLAVTFEPNNLRLKGTHRDTFFAGITKGFSDEDIYSYEVVPVLNESDTVNLQIDLNFTLCSA